MEVVKLKMNHTLMAGSIGIGESGKADLAEGRDLDFDDEEY